MTNKKGFIEHRKNERFKVKTGAIAMIRPLSIKQEQTKNMSVDENAFVDRAKYCQIITVSNDGLSFRYIDRNSESNEPFELDVLFIQDSICFTYLKNIPVQTVGVSQVAGNTSSSDIKTIQRDVQFGEMTLHQESQLDRFIEKYTI